MNWPISEEEDPKVGELLMKRRAELEVECKERCEALYYDWFFK